MHEIVFITDVDLGPELSREIRKLTREYTHTARDIAFHINFEKRRKVIFICLTSKPATLLEIERRVRKSKRVRVFAIYIGIQRISREYYNIDIAHKQISRTSEIISTIMLGRNYLEGQLAEARLQASAKPAPMTINDFANQVDEIAESIADLRLNSTGEVIDKLRLLSKSLRKEYASKPSYEKDRDVGKDVIIRNEAKAALNYLSAIFDVVHSQRLAGIIVSDATAALVGGVGWPGTSCFALSMAAWHGKEAFIAAINKLPRNRK